MTRLQTYILSFAIIVFLFTSCSKQRMPSEMPDAKLPISWQVISVDGMPETKAALATNIIQNAQDLQIACTPESEGGNGKSIGIWTDYSILLDGGMDPSGAPSNGQLVVYENVYDNEEIIYKKKTDGNPHSDWNVSGEDLYWAVGGDYKFRAYYPQSMREYITSNSDADIFILEYKTEVEQEDLCVAYKEVSTNSLDWISTEPVPLAFKHCLSAIRFQFLMEYEMDDKLTSCYLENTSSKEEEAFSTLGLLIYGSSDIGQEEKISWTEGYWPEKGQPFYRWNYATGIPFNKTKKAIAYTTGTSGLGSIYIQNEGWLLIMPQESKGYMNLCFTTEKGGNTVYKVRIPAGTGTTIDGKPFYERGKRYSYTVIVSKTNLKLRISVADWNERKSSIDFAF